MEPNKAKVMAGMSNCWAVCHSKAGQAHAGKALGMLPKREAMVSTSSPKPWLASVAPTNTTMEPGITETL